MMGCLYGTMANHKGEEQLMEHNVMEQNSQIMETESLNQSQKQKRPQQKQEQLTTSILHKGGCMWALKNASGEVNVCSSFKKFIQDSN